MDQMNNFFTLDVIVSSDQEADEVAKIIEKNRYWSRDRPVVGKKTIVRCLWLEMANGQPEKPVNRERLKSDLEKYVR